MRALWEEPQRNSRRLRQVGDFKVMMVGCFRSELVSRIGRAELESATGQQCMTVPCDVRDAKGLTEAMAACAARFGKIDIVVCGAAGNFLCPVVNLSFSAFKKVVEIDLVGTFNTCKASYEYLKKTQGLLLTISMTLHYTGMPLQAHACAAKSGIDALTRTLSNEWGKQWRAHTFYGCGCI